ncbi:MAG: hypothetical protein ACXAC5_23825 [Promethearchaeota archaeon]|jgi:hypothetical protein
MKKSKIIGLSLISALLLFSLTNISHAAPPSYVGVSTGNSFTWIGSANMANVNDSAIGIIGYDNWTLTYNMLDELIENETGLQLGSLLAGGLKASITNISDEMALPPFMGVAVSAAISVSYEPGVWQQLTDGSFPTMYITDPTGLDITNYHYIASGMPLFLPKGIDFNQLATWITANISSLDPAVIPLYNNLTVTALSDGFQATVLGPFLEWALNLSGAPFPIPSLSNVVVDVHWNANGVFSSAELMYGGLTLVTVQLIPGTGEIPGFIIPIFLGASAIALVGVISIIRKKKRIL